MQVKAITFLYVFSHYQTSSFHIMVLLFRFGTIELRVNILLIVQINIHL